MVSIRLEWSRVGQFISKIVLDVILDKAFYLNNNKLTSVPPIVNKLRSLRTLRFVSQ